MTPAQPLPAARVRLSYLDGLRGAALIFMVLNHTARWWMDGRMTWPRYNFIYLTLTLSAPIFLFLVGFCLPLSIRSSAGAPESLGALLRKFVPRGARIILAGLLLNVLVFPDEPVISGGVLQTIGMAIIAMVPALWALARYRTAPAVLLAIAAVGYLAFVLAFPTLTRFVEAYPRIGLVLFYDFPPWPWLSLVLLGLVLGRAWLAKYRESPAAGARYLGGLAIAGATMIAVFFVADWWLATPVRFGLKRDLILNRHWIPQGPALLWVLGVVLVMLAVAYWVMEVRRVRLPWLALLGRTALFLYFVHQLIALPLVSKSLGWRFNAWPAFLLANTVFMVVLIGLGWGWERVRTVPRGLLQRVLPTRPPSGAGRSDVPIR
jgi:uncharacterized membrane protein